jgi:hypothetical protein
LASGTVIYRYDLNGNLQTRNDSGTPSGAVTFAYDPLNRELSETPPTSQNHMTYSYFPAGEVASISDGQLTSSYTYTRVHMAQTLIDSDLQDQGVIRFFYDDPRDTKRTRTVYPNGVTMAAHYDSSGRIDDIRADRGATALEHFSYSYQDTSSEDTSSPERDRSALRGQRHLLPQLGR